LLGVWVAEQLLFAITPSIVLVFLYKHLKGRWYMLIMVCLAHIAVTSGKLTCRASKKP